MTADRTVGVLASQQCGLISRKQALASGLSPHALDHRCRSGRWEPVRPGVYRISGAPASPLHDLMAACLAGDGYGVVSHRAAAQLWGVRLRDPAPLEITVHRGSLPRLQGVVAHRSRDLTDEQITRFADVPITTPTRVLVDLGQVAPWFVVERALDHFIAQKLATVEGARLALHGHSKRGRIGCGALRRVLERRGLLLDDAESVLELAFARLCLDHDLPTPVHQHPVTVAGRERRLDFAYPSILLAIELDGYLYHAGLNPHDDTRARADDLIAAGWTVLHFTWKHVLYEPEWVASVVRSTRRRLAA